MISLTVGPKLGGNQTLYSPAVSQTGAWARVSSRMKLLYGHQ